VEMSRIELESRNLQNFDTTSVASELTSKLVGNPDEPGTAPLSILLRSCAL